jgi:polyphosphate kinase
MLMASNTDSCPWTIIRSDNKKKARINCIKHILNRVDYPDQIAPKNNIEDPEIVINGSEEIKLMEAENSFAKVL